MQTLPEFETPDYFVLILLLFEIPHFVRNDNFVIGSWCDEGGFAALIAPPASTPNCHSEWS